MKKSYLFISAAALAMLGACNKESSPVEVPETEGQKITLTVEAVRGEEATKTTTEYNDNYGSIESKWAAGDSIHVYSTRTLKDLGTLLIDGSSITNEGGGTTGAYATSKATFSGSLTLGAEDAIDTDTFVFIYQGSGNSVAVDKDGEGNSLGTLTFNEEVIENVAGMAKFDIARGTGKILGTAGSYTCAISFSNLVSFGYFSTVGITGSEDITATYVKNFSIDIKNGTVTPVEGKITIPANKEFYLPVFAGTVNISCNKVWTDANTYDVVSQSKSFAPTGGGQFWRLGKLADVPYGPVKFEAKTGVKYDNIATSKFDVADYYATTNPDTVASYVRFTPGNLQYMGLNTDDNGNAAPYWRLAPTQYHYFGNVSTNKPAATSATSAVFTGNLDLFGWGEVGAANGQSTTGVEIPNDGILYFQHATDNTLYLGANDWLGASQVAANDTLPYARNWANRFNTGGLTKTGTADKLYIDWAESKEYVSATGRYKVLSSKEWTALFRNQFFAFAKVTLEDESSVNGIVVFPNTITTEDAAKALAEDGGTKFSVVYKLASNATSLSGLSGEYDKNQINQALIDKNENK